jgi:predicted PurR-regulated permease PerM
VDIAGALGITLTVIAIVLAIAALYAVRVLITSIRTLMDTAEDIRTRLVPLLDKADVTIDAVNAELLRLDAIVTQAEEVGDAVSTASGFIRSPVNSAAQGLARLIPRRLHE